MLGIHADPRCCRALITLWFLWVVQPAGAVLREVPTQFPQLQDALDQSVDGDTVLVLPGVYTGHFGILDAGVTLAGRHLFSGDSSDISATVLDGGGTGSVLRIRSAGQRVATVHGLTLRNGLGATEGSGFSESGGAVDLEENSNATLRWLNIEHNRAPRGGAILTHTGSWGRVRLEHLRLADNRTLGMPELYGNIQLHSSRSLWMEDILFSAALEDGNQVYASILDSLTVYGLTLHGQQFAPGTLVYMTANHVDLRDISVRDCMTPQGRFISISALESLQAADIDVLDNHEGADAQGRGAGSVLRLVSNGTAEFHNIRFNGNRCPHGGSMLHLSGTRNTVITDLEVLGNSIGVPVTLQSANSWTLGTVAKLVANSIDILRVEDNRNELPRLLGNAPYGMASFGGLVELDGPTEGGPVTVRNLVCRRNLLYDPDPPSSYERVNEGSCLQYWSSVERQFRLLDSVFEDNTQNRPNQPPGMIIFTSPASMIHLNGSRVLVADCLFLDNLVGALYASGDSLVLQNVQQVNPGQQGLLLRGEQVLLQNVLVQGVDLPDDAYAHPTTCAVYLSTSDHAEMRNCTVAACHTRSLLGFAQASVSGSALLRNSCFTANQVQRLEHEYPFQPAEFRPAVLEYCLVQEPNPGFGNIVAADHGMRGDRLLREFTVASPCIDAGRPGAEWNDPEDPDHQGHPSYPSQGTLLADIGHLGGPLAKVLPCVGVVPAPPRIRITALPGRVRLAWEPVRESADGCPVRATGYRVEWADDPAGPWHPLATTAATSIEMPLVMGQPKRCFRAFSLGAESR